MDRSDNNNLCACGSGRPASACCGGKVVELVSRYTARERDEAMDHLDEFADRDEFTDDIRGAETVFWGEVLDNEDVSGLPTSVHTHTVEAFWPWLFFDVEDQHGDALADLFVRRHLDSLSPGARAFLRQMRASAVRLYQVEAMLEDGRVRLRDLWAGESMDAEGGEFFFGWPVETVFAARILPRGPGGGPTREGPVYDFNAEEAHELIELLRGANHRYIEEEPAGTEAGFFKQHLATVNQYWLELQAVKNENAPTEEHHSFFFRLLDHPEAVRRLTRQNWLVASVEGTSWDWVTPGGEDGGELRGMILADATSLQFIVYRQADKENGRRLLERTLSDIVQYQGELVVPPSQIEGDEELDDIFEDVGDDSIGPDELAPLLEDDLRELMKAWLDRELKCLDGHSMSELAANAKTRARVAAIVRELENIHQRLAAMELPFPDPEWIWEALNLKRGR